MSTADFVIENFSQGTPKVELRGVPTNAGGDPIIPSISALMEVSKQNPSCSAFRWVSETKTWKAEAG